MRRILTTCIALVTLTGGALAGGSPDQVYDRYAASNSPYSQAVHADAAAAWVAEDTRLRPKGLSETGTRFNPLDRAAPVTGVVDCDTVTVLGHPRAEADEGQSIFQAACEGVRRSDLAALSSSGPWPEAEGPVEQLIVAVKVPGSSQVIVSSQPWRAAASAAQRLNRQMQGKRPPRAR